MTTCCAAIATSSSIRCARGWWHRLNAIDGQATALMASHCTTRSFDRTRPTWRWLQRCKNVARPIDNLSRKRSPLSRSTTFACTCSANTHLDRIAFVPLSKHNSAAAQDQRKSDVPARQGLRSLRRKVHSDPCFAPVPARDQLHRVAAVARAVCHFNRRQESAL